MKWVREYVGQPAREMGVVEVLSKWLAIFHRARNASAYVTLSLSFRFTGGISTLPQTDLACPVVLLMSLLVSLTFGMHSLSLSAMKGLSMGVKSLWHCGGCE